MDTGVCVQEVVSVVVVIQQSWKQVNHWNHPGLGDPVGGGSNTKTFLIFSFFLKNNFCDF